MAFLAGLDFSSYRPIISALNRFAESTAPEHVIVKLASALFTSGLVACLSASPTSALSSVTCYVIAIEQVSIGCIIGRYVIYPLYRDMARLQADHARSERATVHTAERLNKLILNFLTAQNKAYIVEEELLEDNRYKPDETTPLEFICPLTREIIRFPVVVEGTDGQRVAYERRAIQNQYDDACASGLFAADELTNPADLPTDERLRYNITAYLINKHHPGSF